MMYLSLSLSLSYIYFSQNPPKYGTAYSFFKGGEDGREACEAIDSLIKAETISTLLSNFIVPLQTQVLS